MKFIRAAMLGGIAFCFSDLRAATSGDDIIAGGTGNDLLFLLEGDDEGSGLAGNDSLFGDAGSDTLFGGAGNDFLIGGSLGSYGDTAENILIGGGDDDFLIGGAFGDDYHYDLGDGFDVIREFEQSGATADRIIFGAGIDSSSIAFTRSRADLFVDYLGSDILRIESWFAGDGFRIEEFHFADTSVILGSSLLFDGVTWTGTAAVDTYTAPTADAYRMEGLGGGDTLSGGANGDVILGGDGNDTINGNGGDDGIYGQAGNDNLRGNDGSDALFGGEGADTLLGQAGDDLLIGGVGNDSLQGGTGNDVYLWEIGDGDDTVTDATSEYTTGILNTLQFGPGITPDRVTMAPSGSTLKFVVNDANGQPIGSTEITSWYTLVTTATYHRQFWKIAFADGVEWFGANLGTPASETFIGGNGPDIFYGAAGNDTLTGSGGEDQLYGETGADTLNGGSGNDLLVGGPDNDSLNGSTGNDTYLWELGDGDDTITDATSEYVAGTLNILKFGPGITPDRVTMTVSGSDLKFILNDANGLAIGSTEISSWYTLVTTATYHRQFWKIVFDDGTEWIGTKLATPGADIITGGTGQDVIYGAAGNDTLNGGDGDDTLYGNSGNDSLYGNAGNDSIIGGEGNDNFYGGTGNDDFIWNLGDGDDTVQGAVADYALGNTKRIVFGPGISPGDVTMVATSPELKFVVNDSNGQPIGSVKVPSWYSTVSGASHRYRDCFRITFADSTEWVGSTMATPGADVLVGGTGVDIFYGAEGGDDLTGGDGDDELYGDVGNDSLKGGNGNDLLEGGDGGDTLKGDAGNDILIGGQGDDTLYGGTGDDDFIWNLNDGDDTISGSSSEFALGSTKRIVFGPGILPSGVTMEVIYPSGLKFVINDSDGQPIGSLRMLSWYSTVSGSHRYRDCFKIVFENGTEWIGKTMATTGPDSLSGGAGADVLYGGEDNDTLTGNDGDDQLYGGTDNDTLNGGNGSDLLHGEDGADTLNGDGGDDILLGGIGVDVLKGGAGNDQYLWNLGDGNDVITDLYTELNASNRLVLFGIPDVTWLDLQRDGTYALKVNVPALNGFAASSITINDWTRSSGGVPHLKSWLLDIDGIGAFRFANLPTTSADTATGTTGDDLMLGLAGNDSLQGGDGNDLLYGGDGADVLDGGAGDDRLVAGLGDDSLSGGDGNDSYYINAGDGTDTITESASTTWNTDKLIFGPGIEANEIFVERNGNDLILKSKTTVNEITLKDWFSTAERFHAVEHIEFFDGITWEIPFAESRVGDGAGSDNGEGDLGPHELIDEEDLNDSLDNHVPVVSSMQVLTPLR